MKNFFFIFLLFNHSFLISKNSRNRFSIQSDVWFNEFNMETTKWFCNESEFSKCFELVSECQSIIKKQNRECFSSLNKKRILATVSERYELGVRIGDCQYSLLKNKSKVLKNESCKLK